MMQTAMHLKGFKCSESKYENMKEKEQLDAQLKELDEKIANLS